MLRRDLDRLRRRELAWCVAGFVFAQAVLAIGIDRYWLGVRDPEYARLRARLAVLRKQAPGAPLVLFLGSSRTAAAYRAGELGGAGLGGPVITFNYGVNGTGPMMEEVLLRRLIGDGERPAHVFLELMPMFMSRRRGAPLEEAELDTARLSATEVARLYRYYQHPYRLLGFWVTGRLLPIDRHQAELRAAVGLDGSRGPAIEFTGPPDRHGWQRHPPVTAEVLAQQLRWHLGHYEKPLADGAPGGGPLRATADLLNFCRREGIRATLVIPPEGSGFKAAYRDHYADIEAAMREIAQTAGVPLVDTRDWIEESGFVDSHHLSQEGAARFTDRFRASVLVPALSAERAPALAAVPHATTKR